MADLCGGDGGGRLFLGVPLTEEARGALEAHLRPHCGSLPGRQVPSVNWHLTLRFLGDTSPALRESVADELRGAPLGAAFPLGFAGLGAFPRPARATVLWLAVGEGAAPLRALAAEVEAAARRAGFPAEERPFAPHLTLARVQPPRDLRELLSRTPPFPGRMPVDAVVLFRSRLGGGPPRYEALERFPLTP